jgi:tetratricopeptide (TPR) repeat protein
LHEARIYLGLVHSVRGQRSLARRQFAAVLDATSEPVMRGFALLNLGNVHLQEGDPESAIAALRQLVDSGIVGSQPRFGMAYFNLALASGLLRRFDDSRAWFQRLHDEMPHKRNLVARELTKRSQFVHLLRANPEAERRLAADFPAWFPLTSNAQPKNEAS